MRLYFAIALTIAALASWGFLFYQRTPVTRSQLLTFHLAPLAALWLVALLPAVPEIIFYKGAILLGMLLALIGVALHDSDFLPSYVMHTHLGITYILYAYAFSSQTSGWPSLFSLIPFIAAGAIYYWLYPRLKELWTAVALYGFFILLATWQALEMAVQRPGEWMGWAALIGMIFIGAATLLEAQARFFQYRPRWAQAALPVFFMAQLAIAWSIWG